MNDNFARVRQWRRPEVLEPMRRRKEKQASVAQVKMKGKETLGEGNYVSVCTVLRHPPTRKGSTLCDGTELDCIAVRKVKPAKRQNKTVTIASKKVKLKED